MTIQTWLDRTTNHFNVNHVESAWLDAVIILEHFSGKDRAWILAHNTDSLTHLLTLQQLEDIVKAVARRANHEPIAYIVGYKEFFGLKYKVNNNVLIPRPESEDIIDLLDDLGPTAGKHLVDVGTGSGALAISAKLAYPRLIVSATDISEGALKVAIENAQLLNADINFVMCNMLDDIKKKQDIIVANLPYVPPDYEVNKDVLFEPARAIFTENGGLQLIEELVKQATGKLNVGGYIVLESLPSQMSRIKRIADKNSLVFVKRTGLIQIFRHWK